MKTLDAKALHAGIDEMIAQLKAKQEQMKAIQMKVRAIVSLRQSWTGKAGDSIRSFYEECHLPFLRYYDTFITNFQDVLHTMKKQLQAFEPAEDGYIKESFLEYELKNGLKKLERTTTGIVEEANDAIRKVSDIIDLPLLDDDEFHHYVNQAKKKITRTLEQLYHFDQQQMNSLKTVEEDLQLLDNYTKQMDSLCQSGELDVSTFSIFSMEQTTPSSAFNLLRGTIVGKVEGKSEGLVEVNNTEEEQGFWDKAADLAEGAWDATADMADDTWDTVTDVVSEGWDITKNSAVGVATGVWDGLEDTVDGIVGTVKHPLQTAENLKTAALHPLKTIGAIKDSVVDSWNKEMINGDVKSRAHWIGNAATQVALSIFGTKGADKVTKTLKLSKMPKVPNVLKVKRKGQLTKAFNAVHPKLQSVFNVLSPAYIRKVVEKTYDDMLRAAKTRMRNTLDAIGNIGFKVYAVTPEGHKIPVKVTLKDLWLKITSGNRSFVKSISNMNEFFEMEFGKSIRNSLSKSKVKYDGQSIYKVEKKTDNQYLKKGYGIYLDALHKDHLEVIDKTGNVKYVLNLDGTLNPDKTKKALGRVVKGWK